MILVGKRYSTTPFSAILTGWKTAFLIAGGLFLLNAVLVSPYIGWYDSGEFIAATIGLGISHPSGQVLYHLLGKLFLFWPWGTAAFRLGLLSVFCSAGASALFFMLACQLSRSLSPHPQNPLAPALQLWMTGLTVVWSLSLPWWRYSLVVVVYTLHLFLILNLLWLLSLKTRNKWLAIALVLGAAVVFRPTQFFGLPFLALAYLFETRKTSARTVQEIFKMGAFFLLGWSTALYLPLRSALQPCISFASIERWPDLLRQVLALKFSKFVGAISFSNVASILGQLAGHLWTDLTPLGVLLLAAGFYALFQWRLRIPVFFWAGLGWAFIEALFVVTIPFPTFESHQFLYPWVFGGLIAAAGLTWIEHWGWPAISPKPRRKTLPRKTWVNLLFLVWILAQLGLICHQWGRRQERGAQDYARNVLESMEPNALYIPNEENEYFPVIGYQQAFQFRKDVEILEPGRNSPDMIGSKIRDCLTQGRPLYVTRKLSGFPPEWYFKPMGSLLQVCREPAVTAIRVSPGALPLALWGKLGLMNVDAEPPMVQAGGRLALIYDWMREGASYADQSQLIAVYFADAQGSYQMKAGLLWMHDVHESFYGLMTFAQMRPHYWYEEKRVLFVPSDFPPGHYRVMVGLQKPGEAPRIGQESFKTDFYERAGSQNLEKFGAQPANDFLVQYAPETSDDFPLDFLPVTLNRYPLTHIDFATVAEIEVLPPQ